MARISFIFFLFLTSLCAAVEPEEVLVVANNQIESSLKIAEYYCQKRNVPTANIVALDLGEILTDTISRDDYNKLLAGPIRGRLEDSRFAGKVKCLLTVYGVPYKVGPRGRLQDEQRNLILLQGIYDEKSQRLKEIVVKLESLAAIEILSEKQKSARNNSVKKILQSIASIEKNARRRIDALTDKGRKKELLDTWRRMYVEIHGQRVLINGKEFLDSPERLTFKQMSKLNDLGRVTGTAIKEGWGFDKRLESGFYEALDTVYGLMGLLLRLEEDMGNIRGKETNASVDSELSMVMFDDYELYRYQPNELKKAFGSQITKTLMVSRLDGPSVEIAVGLIDKAISAEMKGLRGKAYFDSRYSNPDSAEPSFAEYDRSIHDAALYVRDSFKLKVIEDRTSKLFELGSCPDAALYCGWYSLRKYIDAFDFVDGAVGYHIASFEAIDLRDAASSQWCPAMLADGITATIGPVAEPYLPAFPKPHEFFAELIDGKCLVEAYYRTKPFNSWQMLLIGDPLYRPFNK